MYLHYNFIYKNTFLFHFNYLKEIIGIVQTAEAHVPYKEGKNT